MGLFDYVRCDIVLPDGAVLDDLQTKDFDCRMNTYRITTTGRLLLTTWHLVPAPEREFIQVKGEDDPEIDTDHHGDMVFYDFDKQGHWHEYRARFTHGQLEGIEAVDTANPSPNAPTREAGGE